MGQRAVVERRALHGAVVEPEADRLDHMQFHAETGAQADAGADILRNVRLKKGETHSKALIRAARGLVAAPNCDCFARSNSDLRFFTAGQGRIIP
jgi:hypothetical protein